MMRRRICYGLSALLMSLGLTGCDGWFSVYGILFPSWMVSFILGLAAAAGAFHWLRRSSYQDVLPPPALTYTCLVIIFSILFWLILFRD
jgi:YtcA family